MAGKRFERSLHTLQRQENPPCAACSAGFQARHGVAAAVYHGAPAPPRLPAAGAGQRRPVLPWQGHLVLGSAGRYVRRAAW